MIGDMFNNYLKGRIESLCSDISSILSQQGIRLQGSFQSQSQSGMNSQEQTSGGVRGSSSLFAPDPNQNWWPIELGNPNATGSQNQTQYAYFANSCRLAVKTGTSVWVYDTQDHQIGGFSQQQGGGNNMSFSSQYGTVNLSSLRVVIRDGQAVVAPVAVSVAETPMQTENIPSAPIVAFSSDSVQPIAPTMDSSMASLAIPVGLDIIVALEKLGELKTKGILTDEEFTEKKKELLARL